MTMTDIIESYCWNAEQALHMTALLEDLIRAIWRAQGQEMGALLELEAAALDSDDD